MTNFRTILAITVVGFLAVTCANSDQPNTSTDPVTYEPSSSDVLDNPKMIAAVKEACQNLRASDFVIDTAADAEMALRSFQAGAGAGAFTDDEAAYIIGAGFGRYCPDRIDL